MSIVINSLCIITGCIEYIIRSRYYPVPETPMTEQIWGHGKGKLQSVCRASAK